MPPYSPFLIPLVNSFGQLPCSSEISTTLEEEAALQEFGRSGRLDWDDLAMRVRETYGLPLLREASSLVQIRHPDFTASRISPGRCLLVGWDGKDWLVLEHPYFLPVFDQHAKPGQFPALAKPSLFAHWYTQQETPAGGEAPAVSADSDADSLSALHDILNSLTRVGSPSDWHLEPGRTHYVSRIRIDGHLKDAGVHSPGKGRWLIHSIINQAELGKIPQGQPLEGTFFFSNPSHGRIQIRVSLIPTLHGYALVARFLYSGRAPGHLHDLGLTAPQEHYLKGAFTSKEGLWIVAGPTGSGKTTTLHALLQRSIEANEKAVAIEDPVERTLPGIQHLQVGQPEGLTFPRAIRAFLRQAPDCILVGEIRDRETASIAIQASRTGHRVLSSIHARDTPGVLRRFADLDQEAKGLESVCEVLIHQRLLPLLCPDCRAHEPASSEIQMIARKLSLSVPRSISRPRGCPLCRGGYRGRTGLFSAGKLKPDQQEGSVLLNSAWKHFNVGHTDLKSVVSYIPQKTRLHFALCQV